MGLENYSEPFQQIINGSLIPGVDQQLSESTGGLWYAVLFGLPVVMAYLKTEDISISLILLLWSTTLYGYLIDPSLSTIATITLALGIMALFMKVMWRDS